MIKSKTMKKISLFILLLITTTHLTAQISGFEFVTFSQVESYRFKSSKTFVVLDEKESSRYNIAIKKAVKKFWKLTDYEFITPAEFENLYNDRDKSFIMLFDLSIGHLYSISYLSLFMGGQKYMLKGGNISLTSRPKLLAVVKLMIETENVDNFIYKLPTYIQNLQWTVAVIQVKKIKNETAFGKYVRRVQRPKLGNKTLYILNQDLTKKTSTIEDIKKYYSGKVKIVTKEEIINAIENQDEKIAFVSIVGRTKEIVKKYSYIMIYTAKGGELLHHNYHIADILNPAGVKPVDLKKLKMK